MRQRDKLEVLPVITIASMAFFVIWSYMGTQWALGFAIMFGFGMFFWLTWVLMWDSYKYDKFFDSYIPPEKHREAHTDYWGRPTVFDSPKKDAAVKPSKSFPPADAEFGE